MTDHSDLIERLRAAIDLGDRTGSRGKRPENIYNVADEALTALTSQSLSLSEAREEIERLNGLLRANGKPRFNEAMRRLEAAEHEARVHSDAADGYRDALLSLRASLRKGAEELRRSLVCVKQQCETAVFNISQREHDEAVVRSFQSIADYCARALASGSREDGDGPSKRRVKECCDSEGQPCSRCLEAALSYTSREKSSGE